MSDSGYSKIIGDGLWHNPGLGQLFGKGARFAQARIMIAAKNLINTRRELSVAPPAGA